MFSTPLRDQSHSLIHILFVLCRRFRLMSLKFYCLVIHISHKTLEIGCAWSKGSGERLQGHHGPLVFSFSHDVVIYLFSQAHQKLSLCGIWLTLYSIVTHLTFQQQTAFENIVGEEEIAHSEQFLLFPQCFSSIRKLYHHCQHF